MKTLTTRWRLIALVPLVAIAMLSIGNRIGARARPESGSTRGGT